MPIKPENRARYPKDWRTVIRPGILARARDKCEACGVPNYAVAYWTGDEWNLDEESLAEGFTYAAARQLAAENTGDRDFGPRWIVVVLTVAHLDHTPENCDPANLRAWCQRCHLKHDAKLHQANAAKTRKARKAVGDLFERLA